MPAQVIKIGDPVNESERKAIAYLRENLPSICTIFHNFEVKTDHEFFEVDLAVITPHAVYLVDVKHIRGKVTTDGQKWYPDGKAPYPSPFLKIKNNAKILKGMITAKNPSLFALSKIYVDGLVLITSEDFRFIDQAGKEEEGIVRLNEAVQYFNDKTRVPDRFEKSVHKFFTTIQNTIKGSARTPSGPLMFANWEVEEKLGECGEYTDYRAFNKDVGKRAGTSRLRVYHIDPYLPEKERNEQKRIISTAYRSLNNLTPHPNIIGVKNFFSSDDGDQFILVTDDIKGDALNIRLKQEEEPLTLEQKYEVVSELLTALTYSHTNQIIHRNLTPSSILISPDNHLHLTGFDYAKVSGRSTQTIAGNIQDNLDRSYIAPEVYSNPGQASPKSDLFSAGLIIYEIFIGEKPFSNLQELISQNVQFPERLKDVISNLPEGIDEWLVALCCIKPEDRPETLEALNKWRNLLREKEEEPPTTTSLNYENLLPGTIIATKYVIEKKLGKPGSFGIVYQALDTWAEQPRAIKFLLHDRHSPLDRLIKEYQNILAIQGHPKIVKVWDASLTPDRIPYLVFEYIEGQDLSLMIENGTLSAQDVLIIARDVGEGLVYLHSHEIYHCDIKPSNIIWTKDGARIIDFNVSSRPAVGNGFGGGTRRYLPPDLDLSEEPNADVMADRDLYALGITLYEAITGGEYPWNSEIPPLGTKPKDPGSFAGLSNLVLPFSKVLLKLIDPHRKSRFESADELYKVLKVIQNAKKSPSPEIGTTTARSIRSGKPCPPDTNPFVEILTTFYSQSAITNAGTRGLDDNGKLVYVETALDRDLQPAVLNGEFRLVIITGNAGDGKTAFLQQLENQAISQGISPDRTSQIGIRFEVAGKKFLINYDGSQDQGDLTNDNVLKEFFSPYQGPDPNKWSNGEIRLIAINEGRLNDFFTLNSHEYPKLSQIVLDGLQTGRDSHDIAIINLNARCIVAPSDDNPESLFSRLINKMINMENWVCCKQCDIKDKCYIFHNVTTLQDETAGKIIIGRLESLYTFTHLRGQFHITMRDLRSALAFLITSNRNCEMIHDLYQSDKTDDIVQGYYYNSWMGGEQKTSDRLLTKLHELDIGLTPDPQLDRKIDFTQILSDNNLFSIDRRSTYEEDILAKKHKEIPRALSSLLPIERMNRHRKYLSLLKRRYFFERRDEGWKKLLPFRYGQKLLEIMRNPNNLDIVKNDLIHAINRGEKISDNSYTNNSLVLLVNPKEKGSIRSYRIFSKKDFILQINDLNCKSRFIEHLPVGLQLTYTKNTGVSYPPLDLDLDTFEMLSRLNEGYAPTVEQLEGYCLRLDVFKNILSSAPYQEILLTISGHEYYQIQRESDGRLLLNKLTGSEL